MSKNKKNVIVLRMTAEDEKRSKKRRTLTEENSSDDENEEILSTDECDSDTEEKIPEAIIKKITGADIISKIFTYNDEDVLVILDENKKPWYRGKDICEILEYAKPRNAIASHVKPKYKKSLADMTPGIRASFKIDKKTIFINNTGLFQLVSHSQKPEAEALWEFITEEVLPKLFATGTYSLPAKESDIERLNKNFYDDNLLSDYKNKLAVYLAYIGKYKGKHILKFGKTNDFVERDLEQHRKMYKKFNVIKIWETIANDLVENDIKINFTSKNMLTVLTKEQLKIQCKEKTKRELVTLNEIGDLDYCINMITDVVAKTKLPREIELNDEIKQWKHKCEILEIKLNEKEERIADLKHSLKRTEHSLEKEEQISETLTEKIEEANKKITKFRLIIKALKRKIY